TGSVLSDLGYIGLALLLLAGFAVLWWTSGWIVQHTAPAAPHSVITSLLFIIARIVLTAIACLPLVMLLVVAFRAERVVMWRTLSLVSLVLLSLWAYRFPKIGVSFMPPLDE